MNIALGQSIKRLRLEKSVTQEQLARHFGISCQAVSKWENGTTYPDITLLPELAVFFGVTIDDLFSVNYQEHLQRIDKMLENEHTISHENFVYADKVLSEIIGENSGNIDAYIRKSRLYLHRSNRDTVTASQNARQAMEYAPFNLDLHGIYIQVRKQRSESWVSLYEEFTQKHPDWFQGYFYLIEGYIRDGKLKQAGSTIDKARRLFNEETLAIYEGDIMLLNGKREEAAHIWETLADHNENDPKVLYAAAERLSKIEEYNKAIALWNKAYEIPPHYVNSLYSMAFLFTRLGKFEEAINEWERIIHALKTYWKYSEGATLDWPKNEIEILKNKLASRAV